MGLALARICVSLEFLIKYNFPSNGSILIQFTLEDSSQILLEIHNHNYERDDSTCGQFTKTTKFLCLGNQNRAQRTKLNLIIIIISDNLIHDQEGYYSPPPPKKKQQANNNNNNNNKNTVTIFSSNFIAGLTIFIEIVDFRHTVQMQVTWVPGKLQS